MDNQILGYSPSAALHLFSFIYFRPFHWRSTDQIMSHHVTLFYYKIKSLLGYNIFRSTPLQVVSKAHASAPTTAPASASAPLDPEAATAARNAVTSSRAPPPTNPANAASGAKSSSGPLTGVEYSHGVVLVCGGRWTGGEPKHRPACPASSAWAHSSASGASWDRAPWHLHRMRGWG